MEALHQRGESNHGLSWPNRMNALVDLASRPLPSLCFPKHSIVHNHMKLQQSLWLPSILGIILVAFGFPKAFASGNSCNGEVYWDAEGGRYRLACDGGCKSGSCLEYSHSDAISWYTYCSCSPAAEPVCCHTILRYNSDNMTWYGAKKGSCSTGLGCDGGSCTYNATNGTADCV